MLVGRARAQRAGAEILQPLTGQSLLSHGEARSITQEPMRHLAGEMRQAWPEPPSNISPLMAHRVAPQVTAPQIGANYVPAGLWRGFAIREVNFITGQQNFSGEETAKLLLDTLGR